MRLAPRACDAIPTLKQFTMRRKRQVVNKPAQNVNKFLDEPLEV
jgi:hypothetical protein